MYNDFDFNDNERIHEEIVSIAKLKDDKDAIEKAFHFQRYFARRIKSKEFCTGYEAICKTLGYIRSFIGNEEKDISEKIDYLWGNIPI